MTKTSLLRNFLSLFSPYRPLIAFFSSLFFITLGIGFLSSLIGVRLGKIEDNEAIIGLAMACYFLGLLVGANSLVKLLKTVGHIRLFAFVAAGGASVAIIHSFLPNTFLWAGLRFVSGICSAGVYLIAESWISTISLNTNRAHLLSGYNFITLVGFGGGQFFLPLASHEFLPFSAVALCYCLGILPLALTKLKQPSLEVVSALKLKEIFGKSPIAVTESFVGGMADGIFWGLGPLIALHFRFSLAEIGLFMASVSVGGAFLQWPIGKLSDVYSRQKVLVVISFLCTLSVFLMAVSIAFFPIKGLFLILGALFGGLKYSLYPISMALVNDYITQEYRVEASRTLLILASVGAFLGPFLGGLVMKLTSGYGTMLALCLILIAPVIQYSYLNSKHLLKKPRFFTPFKIRGRSLAQSKITEE